MQCEDLISDMLNLEQTFDSCRWSFTRRMGNEVAHRIAKERIAHFFSSLLLKPSIMKVRTI